jgi:hypothetical protein
LIPSRKLQLLRKFKRHRRWKLTEDFDWLIMNPKKHNLKISETFIFSKLLFLTGFEEFYYHHLILLYNFACFKFPHFCFVVKWTVLY